MTERAMVSAPFLGIIHVETWQCCRMANEQNMPKLDIFRNYRYSLCLCFPSGIVIILRAIALYCIVLHRTLYTYNVCMCDVVVGLTMIPHDFRDGKYFNLKMCI